MKNKIKVFLFSSLLLGSFGLSHTAFAEENETGSSVQAEEVKSTTELSAQDTLESTEVVGDTSKDKEISEAVSETKKNVDKLVGEQKGEEVPIESKPAPSLIRQELLKADYGISQVELDKYSDEQLEQTMTLFTRYNYDFIGMDYGSYVRLLNTLFVDKTVNVNDALTQLYFDPNSFSSYKEMIPQIDSLQTYLRTLYPVNSSFIPGINVSNDVLISKLNELQKFEDEAKAKGETIPFGRIAGIINHVPTKEETKDSSAVKIKESSDMLTDSSQKQGVNPSSSDNKKSSNLPKTGETKESIILVSLGVFTLAGIGYVLNRKL